MAWWHWAVLGLALIVSELAVPSFVLVWFGVGALCVAGMVLMFPDVSPTTQIIVLVLAAAVFILLWFRVVKPNQHKTRIGMADSNLVGQVALLIEPADPFKRGMVRFQRPFLGSDVWACIADENLPVGTRVKVVNVEGSLVTVTRA